MPTVDCGFGSPDSLYLYGPTLLIEIGLDEDFHPESGGSPRLESGRVPALVDTGALESCIDSALAAQLNLPVVNRGVVAGVGGPSTVNLHLAQIHVPDLNWFIYGRFSGVHLSAGGQPHVALIGRDLLRDCAMTYDGRSGVMTLERRNTG